MQRIALYGLFFISGAAALTYQVLFSKQLTYVFGSMSTATNTVLATYMAGLAIGAWLGGLVGSRTHRPITLYAICELLIAVYCAATPLIFHAIRNAYVSLAAGQPPDSGLLLVLRVSLGASALLAPTVLMGMTMPIIARHFELLQETLGRSVGRLYAANTIGAGVGALLAGYVLLPGVGVHMTTWIAVAENLAVALIGSRLARTARYVTAPEQRVAEATLPRMCGRVAIAVLAIGGFITLALEVNFIHLLAIAAGNSTYAFSLMLFSFLIGLGVGAEIGRVLIRKVDPLVALSLLEGGLCVAIIGSLVWINYLPTYFAGTENFQVDLTWSLRESIRGVCCFYAMVTPTICIGAIFTVCMQCIGGSFSFPIRMLGYASALNTVGNIAGVLVAGFFMLPGLGALMSMRILAAAAVVLALGTAASSSRPRLLLIPGIACAIAVGIAFPSLDYENLTTGANVYFTTQHWGHVIDKAESLDGGLTSVHELWSKFGPVRTLLTNGKFQGNNAGEVAAQNGYALAPMLHTERRDNALVIGYGTGNTSRVLHEAGFKQLDIAELSADIVRLANAQLPEVNGLVTQKPGVSVYITDGRNFLLLSQKRYDVISMEVNSIWFAGAASLYSRNFYEIAKSRLSDGGVLQQWVQFHHASTDDIAFVIGSARAAFRYVWLYRIGRQGVIVMTDSADAVPSSEHIAAIDANQGLAETLKPYNGSAQGVRNELWLNPDAVDAYLASLPARADGYISDDNNAHLEYSSPKGNALNSAKSTAANLAVLSRFRIEGRVEDDARE